MGIFVLENPTHKIRHCFINLGSYQSGKTWEFLQLGGPMEETWGIHGNTTNLKWLPCVKTNSQAGNAPKTRPKRPKRKLEFHLQPSIFRCELLVSGRVLYIF